MFITALFTMAKTQKPSKLPINRLVDKEDVCVCVCVCVSIHTHIHPGISYSAIETNEILFAATWMHLEIIILY